MSNAVDLLTQGGFQNADSIVRAANDTGLPLGVAVALIAKESMGRNIYGHDSGGAMQGAGEVTQENFTNQFMPLIRAGHTSNGVGPTQITYPGYFTQNPDLAWWDPYTNMCFGFNLMLGYLGGDYSDDSLIAAGSTYNSGSATGAPEYGQTFRDLSITWTNNLSGSDTTTTSTGDTDMDANQAQMLKEIHDRVLGGLPSGAEPQNGSKILDSNDGGALMGAILDVPNQLLNRNLPREGWSDGDPFKGTQTNLGAIISWFDIIVHGIVSTTADQISTAVAGISTGGIDEDKVKTILTDTLNSAFTEALANAAKGINSTESK